MSPLVGVTTYREQARWGAWDTMAVVLPATYTEAVERAGARALLLPPTDADPAPLLDVLDGLLLSGGADIEPAVYGAEPAPETSGTRPDRDRFELALLRGALERGLPVLAVCRGMQLLNVALGGDLVQHLPTNEDHRREPGTFTRHPVEVVAGTRLASIVGPSLTVPSSHHQGLGRLGAGLVVSGRAPDGVVEAVELSEGWVVGVQWHPEQDLDDLRLFRALVTAAASPS